MSGTGSGPVVAVAGAGRRMKYPYSLLGKALTFPWKFYWKNGRGFRFVMIGIVLSNIALYPIHKMVNSPGNKAEWARIRKAREHDHFAPPTESGGHH